MNPDKDILSFKESSGYIGLSPKTVWVTIKCREERKNWSIDVDIHIRGGNKLTLTIKANIIIPEVSIVQSEFNFGEVAYNEKSFQKLTFQNKSKLSARIIVNLKENLLLRDFHVIFVLNLSSKLLKRIEAKRITSFKISLKRMNSILITKMMKMTMISMIWKWSTLPSHLDALK